MGKYSVDWSKVKEEIVESEKKKGFQKDQRFWKPTVDDKGNATAVIRFLPDKTLTPFVKYYQHNFKYQINGANKFYIKNCINTFGYDKACPICAKNQEYWNSGFESDKKISSIRKRKLVYVSNILVIKNPANPEDEGKVFLYNYGEKIYGKLKDKMFPSEEIKSLGEGTYDEYMPFDLYEGANFKIVQVKQGEFPNYDKSEFNKQSPVGSEKVIDAIMDQVYDLSEFIAPEKFPSNEDVIKELGAILGIAPKKADVEPTSNDTVADEPIEDITSGSLVEDSDLPFVDDDLPSDSSIDPEEEAFFKNLK